MLKNVRKRIFGKGGKRKSKKNQEMNAVETRDASEEEDEEIGGATSTWTSFLAFELKALKFESIHLFQDDEKLVPTSNFTLSMVFYVCSILAFALLTTIYRCEMIENEIGVQKINSVGDCDNLITVNCIDQCGQIYGDFLGTDILTLSRSTYFGDFTVSASDFTYDGVTPTKCRLASDTSAIDYYARVNVATSMGNGDSYSEVVTFSSQSECVQECGQFTVGFGWIYLNGLAYSITSKDCSCVSLSSCTCDSLTTSAPERRVTNSATCKTYFENRDTTWRSSYFITQCDGTLKEVEECKDMITLIGTFGGYVSLIYSAVGFLFFIAISKARFTKLEKKVNKNSEDIEAEMTSFNNNPDDGTHFII